MARNLKEMLDELQKELDQERGRIDAETTNSGKMKKVVEVSKEIATRKAKQEAEKKAEEARKKVRYNWSESTSGVVHIFSLLLICFVTINVVSYLYAYWQNGLLGVLWQSTFICIISECLVICWAICWWVQICPKLKSSKDSLKSYRLLLLYIVISMPAYIIMIFNAAQSVSGNVSSMIAFQFLSFGGYIAYKFLFAWLEYRRSNYYKNIGFIDYCNLPKEK